MITLTPEKESKLLADVKADLVKRLLTEQRDDLQLLSPIQVCALLNVTQPTLAALKDGPPRVTIVVGSVVRYLASDVAAYIQRRKG